MDVGTFLTEFGHIANAPGGVQKLREMVYHLAITGNLVRENNNYDHAQDLINNINLTKDKLIKNKFFKRSPKLEKIPLIIPSDIIIPDNWVWTQLVKLGEINPKNNVEDGVQVSFIPMSGISQLHLGAINSEERQWSKIKKGYTHFADGDVLIAKITPCYENRKSAILYGLKNGIGAGSTEFHVIRPIKDLVEPAYIYTFLRSPYFMVDGETKMTGTAGQNRLPTEYFATRAFPLPPLQEQKRIVAKVDELMALCDRLEVQQKKRSKLTKLFRTATLNALANAQSPQELKLSWKRVQENLDLLFEGPEDVEEIRKAIIEIALSGYLIPDDKNSEGTGHQLLKEIEKARLAWEAAAEEQELKEAQTMRRKIKNQQYVLPERKIPDNWTWGSFLQISQAVVDCHNKTAPYVTEGVHLVRTTDIRNRKMDLRYTKKITDDTYNFWARRMPPKAEDIFFTREAPMGEAAIVPEGEKVCLGQRTMLIRLFSELFDNKFLLYAIYSPSFIERMTNAGIGAIVKHLRVGGVEDLIIPVPPREEQKLIVAKVTSLMALCDTLEAQLTKARSIAEKLAQSAVAAITGTQLEDKKKMKAPKTELVTKLRLVKSPSFKAQAPLCAILAKHSSELSAKVLWNHSGLEIDAFYRQLRTEMANGWIEEPQKAEMRIVEEKESA